MEDFLRKISATFLAER